ncbi:sugar phosphate isomerase/epimerase family protein [Dactylosporangium sp. NPDC000521]|uniref:sugar phosphate isomerase/epimerase family protein n=1 Tax=Dactylosporangium sp. NPDC000521 TaxID=3363975 RepID=UPI003695C5AE
MLGDIYLCASMVNEASFDERLAAASAAGYQGIGLRPAHVKEDRAAGRTDADLRARLDEHGLEVIEVGFAADWWADGEQGARAVTHERGLYELAEAVGARHVLFITGPADHPADQPLELLAEKFAAVCDRAAEHGLRVALECLPWTGVPDLGLGWDLVRQAGRGNGGLVLDTWHLRRGGTTEEMLRAIPPERILTIQLSDGRHEVVGGHLEDTFQRRELPGEGEFDLAGLMRLVESLGVTAPVGAEVLSDRMRAIPVPERARLGLEATRAVLAAARGGGDVPR